MSDDAEGERLIPIDRVAKEAGVASSALRYYERCQLIAEAERIKGRRHYPLSVLHRLSVIRVCQTVGFTLSEIGELLRDPAAGGVERGELLHTRRLEIERQIELLTELKGLIDSAASCGCDALEGCSQLSPRGELAIRTDSIRRAGIVGVRGRLTP